MRSSQKIKKRSATFSPFSFLNWCSIGAQLVLSADSFFGQQISLISVLLSGLSSRFVLYYFFWDIATILSGCRPLSVRLGVYI